MVGSNSAASPHQGNDHSWVTLSKYSFQGRAQLLKHSRQLRRNRDEECMAFCIIFLAENMKSTVASLPLGA